MTALMYHDIVADDGWDASGFPGADAALYKISVPRFDAHLSALDAIAGEQLDLTFDDGGASAVLAADALERHGCRGWFFITANYVGTPGFVDKGSLRDLHRRGHVVGSHSCSHPLRMAHCGDAQLQEEWTCSRSILSDVIGDEVFAASVPGGDFSSKSRDVGA